MRLKKPRISPLPKAEWTDEVREILEGGMKRPDGSVINIFTTLAHHPKLMKRWLVFANYVMGKQTLSPRDRELLILRIGWRCRSEYEWGQHALISRRIGISEEEIQRVTAGPDAPGWAPNEVALLRATDELRDDAMIGDATWQLLSDHYSVQQRMDLVFTVGQYNLVSMALNSFGVQLDEGIEGFPK